MAVAIVTSVAAHFESQLEKKDKIAHKIARARGKSLYVGAHGWPLPKAVIVELQEWRTWLVEFPLVDPTLIERRTSALDLKVVGNCHKSTTIGGSKLWIVENSLTYWIESR